MNLLILARDMQLELLVRFIMLKKYLLLLSVFMLMACSSAQYDQERQEAEAESELDQEELFSALMKDQPLPALKEVVGEESLNGRSELHQLVNCNNPETALYLIQKGAAPKEEVQEIKLPSAVTGQNAGNMTQMKPPLESSLENGCKDLTQVYLEHMAADEVARGSQTLELASMTPEWEINQSEMNFSFLTPEIQREAIMDKVTVADLALKKNVQLCNEQHEKNCEAMKHIEGQIASLLEARTISLFSHACSANNQLNAYQERMRQQLEFGERTGVASPKTYDDLSSQAQQMQAAVIYFKNLFQMETGQELNLQSCGV